MDFILSDNSDTHNGPGYIALASHTCFVLIQMPSTMAWSITLSSIIIIIVIIVKTDVLQIYIWE